MGLKGFKNEVKMAFVKNGILCFMFLHVLFSFGQQIDKHTWKQRVLVILTENKQDNLYIKQCEAINSQSKGLKERKLVVYHMTPTAYAKGTTELQWTTTAKGYKRYKKTNAPFEIILLGLDGGVKLRQTKLVSLNDLYALIDAMPMRRSELKNN